MDLMIITIFVTIYVNNEIVLEQVDYSQKEYNFQYHYSKKPFTGLFL